MFSKNDKAKTPPQTGKAGAAKNASPSILSADMRITGDVVSDGEIQVDGVVEGDIKCEQLTIGEQARIDGEVVAESVHVHGSVTGQIRSRSIFLAKSSHVKGDVVHETLAIEPGAYMEGHVRRFDGNKAALQPQRPGGLEAPAEGKFNVVAGNSTAPVAPKADTAQPGHVAPTPRLTPGAPYAAQAGQSD
ncbi:MAG: polymer-forming cytoskeletal protein [Acetobacterales bacterium]